MAMSASDASAGDRGRHDGPCALAIDDPISQCRALVLLSGAQCRAGSSVDDGMKRVLFLATTTGYQTRMFGEAAERLGRQAGVRDRSLRSARRSLVGRRDPDPVPSRSGRRRRHRRGGPHGAARRHPRGRRSADGGRGAAWRARWACRGIRRTRPAAARDKRLTREQFRDAGLLVPWFRVVSRTLDPRDIAPGLSWPRRRQAAVLSGSRGVIRADLAARVHRGIRAPAAAARGSRTSGCCRIRRPTRS